jgi:alginate O-acetyltransferase complex protein AlgI
MATTMSINSISFLVFLAVVLAAFRFLPADWRAGILFPLSSLVFLILVLPGSAGISAVLGFCVLIWLSTRLLATRPGGGVFTATVGVILLLFGWLKSYEFLSFLPFAQLVPATIGLSYILIRGLQLLADIREDAELRPGPLTVFSFLLAWPCLVSGPVQRFQDFEAELRGMAAFRLTGDVARASLVRLVRGWFWVLVVGDLCEHVWLGLRTTAFLAAFPLSLGGSEFFFLLHLFFNFAGYSEIVIGAGQLFGMRLPENFNRPFEARSFLDFWSRWHMSMSNWFKVYVFNPLVITLTKRWQSSRASNLIGAAAFFATFFLVGLWHGTSSSFVVCGLLLGLGASVNQWYRSALRGLLGKAGFNRLSGSVFYGVLCTGLTFTYVCLSIAPLWLTLDEIGILLGGHGWKGVALAHLFVFGLSILCFSWRLPQLRTDDPPWRSHLTMALQLVVIEIYLFLYPALGGEFFYEQF